MARTARHTHPPPRPRPQVRKAGLPALFVFVAPPSLEELERRLRAGPGGGEAELQRRLGAAKGEITSLNERGLYDYLLINDDLAATAAQLARIAERCAKVRRAAVVCARARGESAGAAPACA